MTEPARVLRPSPAEWDAFVVADLAALGLTYEQLAEQARTGRYESTAARELWVLIGSKKIES